MLNLKVWVIFMRKFNDWTFFYVFTICNIGFEYCKSNVPFCTMPGLHCTPYSVLSTLHVVIYNDMTLLLLFHLGKSSWSIWLLDILELEFDWFSPGVGLGLHMWSMQILFGWIITTLVKPNIRWFGFGHWSIWCLISMKIWPPVNMELISPMRCS